jgi:hypothetical protein
METVTWHVDAVLDFEEVKSREERRATFTAIDKLVRLGVDLAPPHMKKLKGELCGRFRQAELREGAVASKARRAEAERAHGS